MSGYEAGSLFVRIFPDASGFGTDAAREIKAQAPAVQQAANQAAGAPQQTAQASAALKQYQQELAKTAQAFENAQTTSAKALIGKASSEEASAALAAYTQQAVLAARADVELALASGETSATYASSIALLKREQLALEQNTVAAVENGRAHQVASRFRQQARRVAEGEAPISSLLGPSSLLKFGAGALAFGAIVTTLGEVEKSLKVTGDEAFTTEGKFRNLASALLTGNLVEGFRALNASAPSAAQQLKTLSKDSNTTAVDLQNLGVRSSQTATHLEEIAAAQAKVGAGGAFADAIRDSADATRQAADEALALAAAYRTAQSAADDVAASIKAAGSEAAAFGPERGGAGAIDRANARPGAGATFTDNTATGDTQNAVAESLAARTKGLRDDLAQARKEAAQAATLEQNQKDVVEGAAARHRAAVEAQTKVVQIENQIDEQAATAAKAARTERERRVKADAAERKAAAEAARRAAEEAAREAAAARQAEIDRRLSLDDLRIQQAGLTKGLADDRRAIDHKIADLKALRAKTKQYSQEWIDYSKDIASLRSTLANLGSSAKSKAGSESSGFTLQDLFQTASDQFATFGSNISSRNGVLSGQDERAAFGKSITDSVAARSLAQQEQQTAILRSLLQEMRGGSRGGAPAVAGKGKTGNLQAIYGAEIAAAYGYGVN